MPLFTLVCTDKAGALATRTATREAHVAWVRAVPGKVKLAGPFLNEADEMVGSLLIVEAEDLAEARAWAAEDPYARAGVFERVEVRPFRVSIGTLA